MLEMQTIFHPDCYLNSCKEGLMVYAEVRLQG